MGSTAAQDNDMLPHASGRAILCRLHSRFHTLMLLMRLISYAPAPDAGDGSATGAHADILLDVDFASSYSIRFMPRLPLAPAWYAQIRRS